MNGALSPSIPAISEAFAWEISEAGGNVADEYGRGETLLMRAVLDRQGKARPGDALHAGVALRVCDEQVTVCPYTFRVVCRNGAISARALEGRRFDRIRSDDASNDPGDGLTVLEGDLRPAIRACASEGAWERRLNAIRRTADVQLDTALSVLPSLRRVGGRFVHEFLGQILKRFDEGRDQTLFGLMNAITSLARDTADPQAKWQLEELGGAIPALLRPRPRISPERSLVGEAMRV